MSDDILEKAKSVAIKLSDGRLDWQEFKAIVPDLIAEVERLRSAPRSGLYGKYLIQKVDGSPVDLHADYFVLRLDTDPIARRAATEYSYFVASQRGDHQLAKDLQTRIAKYDPKMDDAVYLQYVGLRKNEVLEQLEAKNARIEELEAFVSNHMTIHDNAYLERLEAALLDWMDDGGLNTQEARAALEEIRRATRTN